MDAETEKMIKEAVAPVVTSAMSVAVAGAAAAILTKLSATNIHESDVTGEREMHPTKDEVNMSKVDSSLKDTDASLAKDTVAAKDGELSAMKDDATAMDTEATALDSGASAARTKAGAADIETKAFKMT
jgi:hypothetical protein